MFITIVTDCASPNDKIRQIVRYQSLFGCAVNLVGVTPDFDSVRGSLEAGGTLIDILDASGNKEGIVVVNIAPRGDVATHNNGTPFCFFRYKNKIVISTVNAYVFALLHRFELVESVELVDVQQVIESIRETYNLSQETLKRIVNTQFRSFDFVPYLAHALHSGIRSPSTKLGITDMSLPKDTVWYIDGFGNCKTLFTEEFVVGDVVQTKFGRLEFYNRLKDVPKGVTALYYGSSGIGGSRFIELAVQQGNAAKQYTIKVGEKLFS